MAYRPCGVCESEADEKRFHRLQADTGRVTVFAEDEVMDEFGKDFVLSILPELIADAQKRLDELKIAIDTNNYAMIEFKAHEILGPALNLMFNRLAYVAKHLEFVGKHLGKKVCYIIIFIFVSTNISIYNIDICVYVNRRS